MNGLMEPFDLIYLGRSRFHEGQDATAMYFRVLRSGRYMGAYAGAVSGSDMAAVDTGSTRSFWAALSHATASAIGVRLLGGVRTVTGTHDVETIWVKAAEIRSLLTESLALPCEDEIFRSLRLDEDPLATPEEMAHTRILSVGSTSISLKAATAAQSDLA
ncbi:MAG: hypothetical protein ACR2PK_08690 [Acidimicrobiales bacterium]